MSSMCRSCRQNRCNRPAGLCAKCYGNPRVRMRFPAQSKYSRRRTEEDETWPVKLPPEPTLHLPGTPEKMAVLQDRAAKRFLLHHPKDAILNVA